MMGEQLLCAVCCVLPAGVINPRDSLVTPPPAALAGDGDDGDEATAITAAAARTTTAPPPSPTTRVCFVVGERDHYTDARALRKVVVARRVRREVQKDLSPRTLRTMPNESRRRRVVVARNVEPSPLSSSLATRARREWARGSGVWCGSECSSSSRINRDETLRRRAGVGGRAASHCGVTLSTAVRRAALPS